MAAGSFLATFNPLSTTPFPLRYSTVLTTRPTISKHPKPLQLQFHSNSNIPFHQAKLLFQQAQNSLQRRRISASLNVHLQTFQPLHSTSKPFRPKLRDFSTSTTPPYSDERQTPFQRLHSFLSQKASKRLPLLSSHFGPTPRDSRAYIQAKSADSLPR